MNVAAPRTADPAAFEIIKNSLFKIAEEMRVVLCKTAYSPILKSAGDFSCGVFDARGDMVAQGPDLPIHLGSMPDAVRAIVSVFGKDAHDGDVFPDPLEHDRALSWTRGSVYPTCSVGLSGQHGLADPAQQIHLFGGGPRPMHEAAQSRHELAWFLRVEKFHSHQHALQMLQQPLDRLLIGQTRMDGGILRRTPVRF